MIIKVSKPIDPVPNERQDRRGVFRQSVESLQVGKALIIIGPKQSDVASRASAIGRTSHPNKKFTTSKMEDGSIQLTRLS